MSKLPKSLELDRVGINRLPEPEQTKNWFRRLLDRLEAIHKLIRDRIETLNPQDHIADADGTLADITTKFNTLLSQLEAQDLLEES